MGWLDTTAFGWLLQEVIDPSGNPETLAQEMAAAGQTMGSINLLSWLRYYDPQSYPGPGVAPGPESSAGFIDASSAEWLANQISQGLFGAGTTPGAVQGAPPRVPKPATPNRTPGGIPTNIPSWVVQGVLMAARDTGIPYELALAIVQQESQFNPNAVGDDGCSVGVAQLNTCAGEGVDVPPYMLNDPYQNAKISFTHVKEVMQAHPDWTWGQIAAGAQRPRDQQGYATAINQYVGNVQSGTGALGWGLSAIRAGDPSYEAGTTAFTLTSVPQPFNSAYFSDISQSFGENGEQGTDFAMPVGQPITTPVAGKIVTRDDGKGNWGKAVYVQMTNGWTFFVGHLSGFDVVDGQQVGPGDVLGQSGGDPSDPSSGVSSGPHIEIRFIDPGGDNVDPMTFLPQLYSGKTVSYAQWANGLFSSAGADPPGWQKQALVRTPDGVLVDYNSPQGSWYKAVDSVWGQVYGEHAPYQAAVDFRNAGVTTVDALYTAMNQMPSAIAGVTVGQYKTVTDAANSASQKAFGRTIPQSLVNEFFQRGITSSADIQLWFESHGSSALNPDVYQAIYDSAQGYTRALYNDVPHPNDVMGVASAAGYTA